MSRPRSRLSNGKQWSLFIASMRLTGAISQVPSARGPASFIHLGNLPWVVIIVHGREPAGVLTGYITLLFQNWVSVIRQQFCI